ncbi:MAG: hypothetical protein H6737_01170 [Alphaproteobacteria bacterium]|nr:hypothetical protein [Alphaproteobacteria bacterium]
MKKILLPLALLLGACQTPCQRLCVRMADYAEECGFTVSDAEIDTCIAEQADAEDQGACRAAGAPAIIRDQLSCDELEIFFQ